MPSIIGAKINDRQHAFFNIDFSVGTNGENRFGDVLLIQALLMYVEPLVKLDGVAGDMTFPSELTGIVDDQTSLAIYSYQLNYGHVVLNVDGLIHPPNYENRKLQTKGKKLMTMTFLQYQAVSAAGLWGHDLWPKGMIRLWPRLMPWIRRN